MDGHIMRCGTIGSCHSAVTSEIVKALLVTSRDSCKRRYNKCPDLYIYTFWAKLEQEQGSKIPQNIRMGVNRLCRNVKQVLTPSE